jgi:hypothetical protein
MNKSYFAIATEVLEMSPPLPGTPAHQVAARERKVRAAARRAHDAAIRKGARPCEEEIFDAAALAAASN